MFGFEKMFRRGAEEAKTPEKPSAYQKRLDDIKNAPSSIPTQPKIAPEQHESPASRIPETSRRTPEEEETLRDLKQRAEAVEAFMNTGERHRNDADDLERLRAQIRVLEEK